MILSIAMIVKNEEKNLERTLKALKALDNKIDFEIVIVDTGSEDNTIKIAKKYTSRIYEHKWTGDFAEMRNISIKYCKGKWILILDADEVLENPEELINFFKNNEHKNSNCAIVKIKNLLSEDENNYLMGGLVRLFKNIEGFCYEGRVHEQPKLFQPIGNTKICFLHYGYSRADYELMRYKYERNIKLLLKDLEDDKKDRIYTLFQLAQSYSMANEDKETLKAIKEAFLLVKNTKNKGKYLYVYHFYGRELLSKGNYEKAIELCEEAIKYNEMHIDLYYILTQAYKALNKYENAEFYFDKYFKLRKKKETGYIEDISVSDFSSCRINEMKRDRIINYYNNKEYFKVVRNFKEIEEESYKEQLKEIYFYSSLKIGKKEEIQEYFKDSTMEDKDIQSIIAIMQRIELDGTEEIVEDIVGELIGLDKRLDFYIEVISLNKNIKKHSEYIEYNDFYIWKGEILKKSLQNDNSLLDKIKELYYDDKEKYIAFIASNYECLKILYDYSVNNFLTRDISTLKIINIIEKQLIFNNSIDNLKHKTLLKRTFINNVNYINKVYNKEIQNEEELKFILNKYEFMWVNIKGLIKNYSKDRLGYVKGLRNIIKNMPEGKKIIEDFMGEINSEPINEAMEQERRTLLVAVEQLCSENKLVEAKEILDQLSEIFLYDGELLNTRGVVCYLLGENEQAFIDLSMAYELQEGKFDALYNLSCIFESTGKADLMNYYLKEAYEVCKDNNLKQEIFVRLEL